MILLLVGRKVWLCSMSWECRIFPAS